MKYATIIPLIGGMTVANRKSTGKDPEFLISWDAFKKNDSHIQSYLPEVPNYLIPNEGEDNVTEKIKEDYKGKLDFVSTVCPCAGLSMLNNARGSESASGSDASQNDWMFLEIASKCADVQQLSGISCNTGQIPQGLRRLFFKNKGV